ncbi:hypothetical protein Ancab_018279 [Ancistrocladus abbreviatus]
MVNSQELQIAHFALCILRVLLLLIYQMVLREGCCEIDLPFLDHMENGSRLFHELSLNDGVECKKSLLVGLGEVVMFNSEAPKKLQPHDSETEALEGFEIGSFYSSGGRSDRGSGGSASDFGYGSSSKSSKSASTDSSSYQGMKESKFTLVAGDGCPRELSYREELAGGWLARTSLTVESSAGSGDSSIGLKLGKRTYFKDASAGRDAKKTTLMPAPSAAMGKRSKSSSLNMDIPRCQVEGCNLDLSSAKDYHRKNRVCESHSKSPKVIVAGLERRFCQQCSRFHNLSEFDQKKRSCRKRLSDHNARRRKPKPDIMQFSSTRLSSSLYEGRPQMLAFNQVPLAQPRPDANPSAWDSTSSSKFGKADMGLLIPTDTGDIDELQLTHNEVLEPGTKLCHDSTQLLPSKGRLTEFFHRGLEVYTPSSEGDAAAQDLRALSLLSTNPWGACGPEPVRLNPTMDSMPLILPSASSVYWEGGQPVTSQLPAPSSHKNASSHFPQEFQLFKEPQEPSLYWF